MFGSNKKELKKENAELANYIKKQQQIIDIQKKQLASALAKNNIATEMTKVTEAKTLKRKNNETSPEIQDNIKQANKKFANTQRPRSSSLHSRTPSLQSRIPDYWLATKNQNPFNALEGNTAEEGEASTSEAVKKPHKISKPPPLFVHGASNIKPLIAEVEKLVGKRYTIKSLPSLKIKLQTESKEDYGKVVGMMDTNKTEYHSYQIKEEKPFKCILKGIHQSTDTQDIKDALFELGHSVKNIACLRSKRTGQDLPMFFIGLKNDSNNKTIYKIDRLLNMVVTVEPPRTQKAIPQCERCQRFGHTKSYCHLGPRCVKCTQPHLTNDCPRTAKDNDVKCVNCKGDHPANYRGCEVYQDLRKKLYPALRKKSLNTNQHPQNHNNGFNSIIEEGQTFADLLKKRDEPTKNTPSSDMDELKNMMKDLMGQMTTMLNLLTMVVNKIK